MNADLMEKYELDDPEVWVACLWPEEVLGYGPYYWDTDGPVASGAWRGSAGWVGDPERMRREAMATLGMFEAGVCPNCHQPLTVSSPGWVRCPTSNAAGPRGGAAIEYQIRTVSGRPTWFVRCVPLGVTAIAS